MANNPVQLADLIETVNSGETLPASRLGDDPVLVIEHLGRTPERDLLWDYDRLILKALDAGVLTEEESEYEITVDLNETRVTRTPAQETDVKYPTRSTQESA